MNWTDERVELLKKLWAEGFSASQIATQLGGVTRNAVIGKAHRLKLAGRTKAQPRIRKAVAAGNAGAEAGQPGLRGEQPPIAPPQQQGRQATGRANSAGGAKHAAALSAACIPVRPLCSWIQIFWPNSRRISACRKMWW